MRAFLRHLLPGVCLFALAVQLPASFNISQWTAAGTLTWTNAPTPGICTVETSASVPGSWQPAHNIFSPAGTGSTSVNLSAPASFVRLSAVDVPPTPRGFTNLIQAYGLLETVAGYGEGRVDGVSYWQPQFEGGPATEAALSRPHYAMGDQAGNIYIADKNSHSVLRVATDGSIHTHAGNHLGGFNGEGPASATNLQLNFPNALWVRGDGTVYVLDTDNARVRRVATNGIMVTLFNAKDDPSTPLSGGRCLWVKDDESLAYFGNKVQLRKWTPGGGLQTLASGLTEIGNFYVEPGGDVILADRGANYVYRINPNGTKTVIAGNGSASGGGDGSPALQSGIYGPRGVWPVPTGGYLLLLHDGAQLWYVDAANIMHLLVNGQGGNAFVHAGDNQYFYAPAETRIGEGRSVALDYAGNIIICESDYGFIRRIQFKKFPF